MKRSTVAVAALLAATLSMPMGALAGPDALQQQLLQRLRDAKAKQEQAEQAKGMERDKLLQDHLKMMEQSMKMMMAMKPKKGMTMQEHEEWIAEHQKIMEQMMEQMMKDQQMLMELSK